MRKDAECIIRHAIACCNPYENTKRALQREISAEGSLAVFSIGKAAVPMARAAAQLFADRIKEGLVVTKYGHAASFFSPFFEVIQAAHPLSDENSERAVERALEAIKRLNDTDECLILLSGGGSALFEKSRIPAESCREINRRLLLRGADIGEINAVRKRISLVKGGRFAAACYPRRVFTFALSDVLGNDKGTIASGISVADAVDDNEIKRIIDKYLSDVPREITSLFFREKEEIKINSGGYFIVGDVRGLCGAAAEKAKQLGYETEIVSCRMTGEACSRAAELVKKAKSTRGKRAFIYGGETTVRVKGRGKGGRNQEMALCAAVTLRGEAGITLAFAGSDGTDGPTDAAGGIVCGDSYDKMIRLGISPEKELENNNSYYALKKARELLFTGPTMTNVNDIALILTDN